MSKNRFRQRHLSGTWVTIFLFAFAFVCIAVLAPTAILWDHLYNNVVRQNESKFEQVILFSAIVFLSFGAFGTLVFITGLASWRDETERKELSAAHPNQPWLWKDDWRNESVRHSTLSSAISVSALSVVTITIPWGLVALILLSDGWSFDQNLTGSLGIAIIVLPFCFVGLGIGLDAITKWIQYFRWGESKLELATVPSHPGGPLIGLVQFSRTIPKTAEVAILTTCSAQRPGSRSHGDRSTGTDRTVDQWYQATIYQSRTILAWDRVRWDSEIPLWIDIPKDAIASNPERQTVWEVSVRIRNKWNCYEATFAVPVFRVVGATANSKLAVVPAKRAWCAEIEKQRALLAAEDIDSVVKRSGGHLVRNSADAIEIVLPLDSTPWGFKEATAILTASVFFGWSLVMPGWQGVMITLLPIAVIALLVYRRIKKQRLVLTRDRLGYHRPTFFGLRWTERDADDIQSIGAWFDDRPDGSMLEEQVMFKSRSNQRITILRGLPERWMGQQIAQRLQSIPAR